MDRGTALGEEGGFPKKVVVRTSSLTKHRGRKEHRLPRPVLLCLEVTPQSAKRYPFHGRQGAWYLERREVKWATWLETVWSLRLWYNSSSSSCTDSACLHPHVKHLRQKVGMCSWRNFAWPSLLPNLQNGHVSCESLIGVAQGQPSGESAPNPPPQHRPQEESIWRCAP